MNNRNKEHFFPGEVLVELKDGIVFYFNFVRNKMKHVQKLSACWLINWR